MHYTYKWHIIFNILNLNINILKIEIKKKKFYHYIFITIFVNNVSIILYNKYVCKPILYSSSKQFGYFIKPNQKLVGEVIIYL